METLTHPTSGTILLLDTLSVTRPTSYSQQQEYHLRPEILTETAAATQMNIFIGISSEIIPAMESQQNADKSFWRRVPKTAVDTMGIIGDTNVRVLTYLAGHSETSSALELPHILDAAYPAKTVFCK